MLEQLLKLGFSADEAKIYLAALELGESSVARIANKAKIERTTAYLHIESLKRRGLISVSRAGKKTVYTAESPKKLRNELDEKWKLLEGILPEMLSITNSLDKKPRVRFFDSKEGVYDIYRETLLYPDSRMYMWMSTPWYDDEKFWTDYYLPARLDKKIHLSAIVPKTEESVPFVKEDSKSLRETRMTDSANITADIVLYGNRNIAIISFDESTALVIESGKLFETLRMIFEAHWELLSSR
jgi:sugar-specific transcriptional regulator TrmB